MAEPDMTRDQDPIGLPPYRPVLEAAWLKDLAQRHGADDCGLVAIDDPAIDEDRPHILSAFPATRVLLVLLGRMNREPVRSPARSLANLEFHQAGDSLDETARSIVRELEDRGIRALNPALAFPMEMERFPQRGWVVSHKRAAVAAGLGRMGIHRSLIHPKYGSFVLLDTVLIAADVQTPDVPLAINPCLECKLCVAACPVGALKPDGAFDFSACFTHNYQQFMGGFVNWIEDIAESRSAQDYRNKHSYAETVQRWQSLSYKPNYNAAYCIAVCPAGSDVIGPYLQSKKGFRDEIVRPLQNKEETIYVVRGSDAADHVAQRFPHKIPRLVRASARATTIGSFLFGLTLSFQRGKAKDLAATYHFTFTGVEKRQATVIIRDGKLSVADGLHGDADLRVTADARSWLRYLAGEISIIRCLVTRAVRLKGPPRLLLAFGKCFPM
jgi:ferredoxin